LNALKFYDFVTMQLFKENVPHEGGGDIEQKGTMPYPCFHIFSIIVLLGFIIAKGIAASY